MSGPQTAETVQLPLERFQAFGALQAAGMITLGWVVAKDGHNAPPVVILAQALKDTGCVSSYLDDLLTTSLKLKGGQ